jgi:CheY-like chemotaxis protein/MinD-like ATPase involved in chromosome partitioning or flagellar assembly
MADKILIVDDEIDTLRLIGLMLEKQGYNIVAAESGLKALEVIKREKPDLVLLDVMMPDLDGFEVAKRIRGDMEIGETPIIMFTAKTQVEDKVIGLESGADVYLTKPTQPRELFAQVKVLLARSKRTLTQPLPKTAAHGELIGVIGAKGGVGVTTIVINLGIMIHQLINKKVLVVDFHLGSGGVSWDLGYHAQLGLNKLLDYGPEIITSKLISEETLEDATGINLLLSSQSPKEAVQILEVEKIKAVAEKLPYIADWTIMDLGSNLLPSIQTLIRLCHHLILIIEPTASNIIQTKGLIDDLLTLGVEESRIKPVIVNRTRTTDQLNYDRVENELGHKILCTFTPAPELALQSTTTHVPMVIRKENNITAQQFEELATKITSMS